MTGPLLAYAALEAASFAGVVLWAYQRHRPLAALGLLLASAVVNVLLVAAWPWVLTLPAVAAQWMGLGNAGSRVLGFSFYSAAGAITFCGLIDGLLRPRHFMLRPYGLTTLLCAGAGLPFAFESEWLLRTHKAAW